MHPLPRHFILPVAVAVAFIAGCSSPEKKPADVHVAAAAPAAVLLPFEQDIPSFKATITLPGAWKYGYRMIEKADTLYGGFHVAEFYYTADTARRVPPRLLMAIRAFKKPAYEKVRASQKGVANVLAEHSGIVYTYSIVTASPYGPNAVSTLRVDQMMLPIVSETSPLKLTFK